MKKLTKSPKALLLSTEKVRNLDERTLQHVVGGAVSGGGCNTSGQGCPHSASTSA
jgi:hypothetical protein